MVIFFGYEKDLQHTPPIYDPIEISGLSSAKFMVTGPTQPTGTILRRLWLDPHKPVYVVENMGLKKNGSYYFNIDINGLVSTDNQEPVVRSIPEIIDINCPDCVDCGATTTTTRSPLT
jgi:hypothetical protein